MRVGRLFPVKRRNLLKKNRKQSFCREPRGSERYLLQVCCPGPGSASKGSDSGPSLSFSGGIPGSFLESQLDILNDPAVKRLEAVLRVRDKGPCYPVLACPRVNACSCVAPLSRRHSGYGNEGENQLDRVVRVSAGSRALPARCPPGRVSVAVPGEHSPGSNAVTVAVLCEHSRRLVCLRVLSLMIPRILPLSV